MSYQYNKLITQLVLFQVKFFFYTYPKSFSKYVLSYVILLLEQEIQTISQ